MAVLRVLLLILKIIGITLLVILGVVLFLLLVILLAPVRYKGKFKKQGRNIWSWYTDSS